MIFSADLLRTKSIPELRVMLVSKGANWHPREKAETLITRIIQISATAQPGPKKEKEADKPKVRLEPNTQPDVLEAIKAYLARGLSVEFSDDGEGWHFKRELRGAFTEGSNRITTVTREDSGSMRIPLSTIKRCADMLMTATSKTSVSR